MYNAFPSQDFEALAVFPDSRNLSGPSFSAPVFARFGVLVSRWPGSALRCPARPGGPVEPRAANAKVKLLVTRRDLTEKRLHDVPA